MIFKNQDDTNVNNKNNIFLINKNNEYTKSKLIEDNNNLITINNRLNNVIQQLYNKMCCNIENDFQVKLKIKANYPNLIQFRKYTNEYEYNKHKQNNNKLGMIPDNNNYYYNDQLIVFNKTQNQTQLGITLYGFNKLYTNLKFYAKHNYRCAFAENILQKIDINRMSTIKRIELIIKILLLIYIIMPQQISVILSHKGLFYLVLDDQFLDEYLNTKELNCIVNQLQKRIIKQKRISTNYINNHKFLNREYNTYVNYTLNPTNKQIVKVVKTYKKQPQMTQYKEINTNKYLAIEIPVIKSYSEYQLNKMVRNQYHNKLSYVAFGENQL
jgi:hypothetical protein